MTCFIHLQVWSKNRITTILFRIPTRICHSMSQWRDVMESRHIAGAIPDRGAVSMPRSCDSLERLPLQGESIRQKAPRFLDINLQMRVALIYLSYDLWGQFFYSSFRIGFPLIILPPIRPDTVPRLPLGHLAIHSPSSRVILVSTRSRGPWSVRCGNSVAPNVNCGAFHQPTINRWHHHDAMQCPSVHVCLNKMMVRTTHVTRFIPDEGTLSMPRNCNFSQRSVWQMDQQ